MNEELAKAFVAKYPNLFTEDQWFWEEQLKELLDKAVTQNQKQNEN